MEELAVKATKLKKVYHLLGEDVVALKEIDLTIKRGEFVTIMGPSGAGKTTLLNLIGCLDTVTSGKLEIFGHNVSYLTEKSLTRLRRDYLGFIFQEFFLISEYSARENVELPLVFAHKHRRNPRPELLLKRVGLGDRMGHLPKELSGGQLQRVAIARALANEPKIILADEPTGNLDTINAQGVFDLFRELNQKDGLTVIVATHNVKLGYQADRVVHLSDGNIIKDEFLREESHAGA